MRMPMQAPAIERNRTKRRAAALAASSAVEPSGLLHDLGHWVAEEIGGDTGGSVFNDVWSWLM